MLVSFLMYTLALFIEMAVTFTSVLGLAIPDFFESALNQAVFYVTYLKPILPLYANEMAVGAWSEYGIFDVLGFMVLLITAVGLVSLVFKVLRLLPGFSKFKPALKDK